MQTERIWAEFRNELYHFILSRVKDVQLAEDILQDVFIRIHLNLKNLQAENKLTSWLYQITRNAVTDHFRKLKPAGQLTDLVEETSDENDYLRFEKCMLGFVRELPEIYRDALMKTELGEMSQKDYAQQLGISYSGAKSRVQRAKDELRELFVTCCAKKIPGTDRLEAKDPENCKCR